MGLFVVNMKDRYFPPAQPKKEIKQWKKETLIYPNCDEEAVRVGVIKKKHDKRKTWKEYYTILFCDHLIFYKPGDYKDKIPKPPGEPVEWINLQYCTDYLKIGPSKTFKEPCFDIPCKDVTYVLDPMDTDAAGWINDIKNICQELEKHNPEREIGTQEALDAQIKKAKVEFPLDFKLPSKVEAKSSGSYISDMKRHYENKKKWDPYLSAVRLYIRYYQGDAREYCIWYFNGDVGLSRLLKKSEALVTEDWKDQPDITIHKVEEKLAQPQILRGDVKELNMMITNGLTYIKAVNDYRREIFGISDPDPKLQPKIKEMAALAQRVKVHPIYNPDA